MKVFLSHSTKDKQFVQALAAELETEKIETWLCEIDIEFGQNFVAKIEEGLRNADLTVLFCSVAPQYPSLTEVFSPMWLARGLGLYSRVSKLEVKKLQF